MRSGAELYAWLAALPPGERDAAVERMLGIEPTSSEPPGAHLVGHHLSGVAAIVRFLLAVPVREDDVVLDLGAGVGKLLALTHLLTGATVRGVEIQETLARRAVPLAEVVHDDARTCELRPASVIVLYCPFEGPVLEEVSRRLDALAEGPPITVCALGVELRCARLRPRPGPDFWMTIWDSAAPRPARPMPPDAQRLAHERIDH